jgi:hypothetical protein
MTYKGQLGYLVSVSNTDEYDFIYKTLGARNVWLGATDIRSEDKWINAAGPDIGLAPASDLLRSLKQKGGSSANCIMSIGSSPADANCNDERFFVIEFECQTVTSTECECKLFAKRYVRIPAQFLSL